MRVSTAYLERVAREWQRAFEQAHGKTAPAIQWSKGWFRIENGARCKFYRRTQIEEMTRVLLEGYDDL